MRGFRLMGLCWALYVAPAYAIVNIEQQRGAIDQQGFNGSLHAAVDGATGNTDKVALNLGADLRWRRKNVVDILLLDSAYGQSNGVRDTNRAFVHVRHIVIVRERRSVELFAQVEHDEFTRLQRRALLGGGLRFRLFEATHDHLDLGVGAMYVQETLDDEPGLTDGGTDYFWRLNSYLNWQTELNDTVRFVSTAYYQPALDDPEDFRLLADADLKVKLASDLDLKLSLEIAHDSRPPQTVEPTDVRYLTGIELHF